MARFSWVVLVLFIGVAAFVVVTSYGDDVANWIGGGRSHASQDLPPEFDRLAEVWSLLKAEHVDREHLDPDALSEGAIRGMLQAMNDPYASFLNAEQYSLESQDFKGYFEGIGAQVAMRDGKLTIIAPLPDSPAQQAGILPGDVILTIDGESAAEITLLEAVAKIRGQKGTIVELQVLHLKNPDPVNVTVTRGVIQLESVRLEMRPDGFGHLHIYSFTDTTPDELEKALKQFRESNGVGLILDLRNNPGGLLSSVVEVASEFLDGGLVLYEVDSQGQRTDWKVKPDGQAQDVPMVVLINQFSASASEVLSGALRDHQRARLVGVTSFGKGSVNTLRALSDGSGVYYSIARWFTPNGNQIEGKGIDPDVEIEAEADSTQDVQLARAVAELRLQISQGG